MATQGIVSVVSGGKVVMKVVAGCNGMKAQEVADQLRVGWPHTAADAYTLANTCGFGCEDCLVVVTESETVSEGDEELSASYRETFNDPRFNPRWKQGIAGHTVVIEV